MRGFSLIETMIAAALLGIIGAAVASVLGYAARESGQSRVRTIASTNAREAVERVAHAIRLAEHHRLADADLCALLESAGGPMDTTAPAAAAGACPARTVSNIPITGTLLRRRTTIIPRAATADMPRRYEIEIEVSGNGLGAPILARTEVLRDSK